MKNQPDDNSTAVFEDLSEAFYKSLFDLKILTHALLEGQFVPAARVMVMTANASSTFCLEGYPRDVLTY